MKKTIISAILIFSFAVYALFEHRKNEDDNTALTAPANLSNATKAQSALSLPAANQASVLYKDGTYTGTSEDAFYGYVQVRATVAGGQITSVDFLDYPRDRRESQRINQQATPWLSQEAIQSQSANVDIISGATDTSFAFRRSLTSALAKAKA